MTKVYNFSSGPSTLPVEVLTHVKQELINWHGLGTSVMEISHRSKEFIETVQNIEKDFRDLMKIPANYKVLFCHGGARGQFAAIPGNLLGKATTADYIDTGYWANSAIKEAQKYCNPNVIDIKTIKDGKRALLSMSKWNLREDAAYVHFCQNETIDGLVIKETPNFAEKVVVTDFSSIILSCPIDVKQYSVIYASAQKNMGTAGLTIVIIRDDLLDRAQYWVPSILNYKILSDNKSMFNTPPTFIWYLSGLIFKWLKKKGGIAAIAKMNQAKSNLLYQAIDNSTFYDNNVMIKNRSNMNVPFQLADPSLNKIFLKESFKVGLHSLKGHRVVGGMRASIYNAMPLEGVKTLIEFMGEFERCYG